LKDIFWGSKPFHELARWKDGLVSIAGGWPAKAVTFLDNHDTYRKAYNDFPTDNKRLVRAYAFLLTHPGIPCIFWNHLFERDTGYAYEKIKALGQLRVNSNITNQSKVDILAADSARYVAMVDGHTIVKIGDGSWSPYGIPGFWDLKLSGWGWAIWQQ
jgi:alpha-amylase